MLCPLSQNQASCCGFPPSSFSSSSFFHGKTPIAPHFRFLSKALKFVRSRPFTQPFCRQSFSIMVTKTSTSSSAPTDASVSSASATATATASSSVVATTPSPASSDCLAAPTGTASSSGVISSPDTASPSSESRYACVPPAVLQSVKTSLTFRKSCLRRSKSSTLPSSVVCEDDAMAIEKQMERSEEKKEKGRPVQTNRRRCWECKVKVGLAAVKCRCEYTFCGKHRYAEEHKCVFNFKTAGKRKLQEENPIVVPSKVARIN